MATIKKGLAISGVLIVALLMIKYLMKDVPPSPFALEISDFLKTNSKSIGSFALVIFLLLILIGLKDWDMNAGENTELEQVVTIEKLTNLDRQKGFCENNKKNSDKLEKKCNDLTKTNCNVVNCCVYLNGNKCVAGDKNGPVFTTDDNDKKIDVDTYYFRNKCYGKNC